MKKVIISVVAVVVFILSFVLVRYFSVNPYKKRILWTRVSLNLLRGGIESYKNEVGEFPGSLSEMKDYYDNHDSYTFKLRNEYISCEEGLSKEYSLLNGEGGWYYNKETGEITVNIDKPLKDCFEHYYYSNRNEIPSEW